MLEHESPAETNAIDFPDANVPSIESPDIPSKHPDDEPYILFPEEEPAFSEETLEEDPGVQAENLAIKNLKMKIHKFIIGGDLYTPIDILLKILSDSAKVTEITILSAHYNNYQREREFRSNDEYSREQKKTTNILMQFIVGPNALQITDLKVDWEIISFSLNENEDNEPDNLIIT